MGKEFQHFPRLFLFAAFLGSIAGAQDLEVPAIPGTEGPTGPPLDIKPQFVLGHTYRYVTELDLRARLPDRGVRSLLVEQQARFDVDSRDDDKPGWIVRGRTEHLALSLRSAGDALDYDSFEAEDRKSKLGQHLQPSLLEKVEVVLNRDGRMVTDRVVGGSMAESEVADLPRYGSRELIDLVQLLLQGRSSRRVFPGGTWNLSGVRSVEGAGELTFDLQYRRMGPVEFEGHACERITVSGTLSGELPAGAVAVENEEEGEETFDRSARFEEARLTGELYYDPTLRAFRFLQQSLALELIPEDAVSGGEDNPARRIILQQRHVARLLHRIATP